MGKCTSGQRPVPAPSTTSSFTWSVAIFRITKVGTVPGGKMYFRAAACTGALYHIELYLVCGDLPDLRAGVYHFGAHDFSLHRLREGDYRGALLEASGGQAAVAEAPATIVLSSVYWRNSWKYQARAYRHAYWDSGTILANLLAVGNANRIPLKLVTSFVDEPVNRLLDLDTNREVALQLVPAGRGPADEIGPPAREKNRRRRVLVVAICSPRPIPRRPAGQVVGHHLYRQPSAVGGEAAGRHVVQTDAVLEVSEWRSRSRRGGGGRPPVPGSLRPGR